MEKQDLLAAMDTKGRKDRKENLTPMNTDDTDQDWPRINTKEGESRSLD
jgi:hypothetical protein